MKLLIAIGSGSFIGGVLRYLISQFIQIRFLSTYPYGTLGVNVLGCFLIGLVFGLADRGHLSAEWRMVIATGLLGGFTTFSAFSNETIALLRDGQLGYATLYVAGSVVFGLFATFSGISIVKLF